MTPDILQALMNLHSEIEELRTELKLNSKVVLTRKEAAEYFGCSEDRFTAFEREGLLHIKGISKNHNYYLSDLESFRQRYKISHTPAPIQEIGRIAHA